MRIAPTCYRAPEMALTLEFPRKIPKKVPIRPFATNSWTPRIYLGSKYPGNTLKKYSSRKYTKMRIFGIFSVLIGVCFLATLLRISARGVFFSKKVSVRGTIRGSGHFGAKVQCSRSGAFSTPVCRPPEFTLWSWSEKAIELFVLSNSL